MKITGIRTQPYQIKMKRPIGDSNNPTGHDWLISNTLSLRYRRGRAYRCRACGWAAPGHGR